MRYLSFLLTAALGTLRAQASDESENVVGAYFRHKTVIIPHDSKRHRGGEDAAATSDSILVVSDGVGGWARRGVNPGLYSRMLSESIVDIASRKNQSLVDIVHEANWKAASEHLGSATCTVVRVSDSQKISTLNIGDSGYALFRLNMDEQPVEESAVSLLYESKPGQKSFNFPYQLGGRHGDTVADVAVEKDHEFQNGDIIVLFSDGVSDNMYPKDFKECLSSYIDPTQVDDNLDRIFPSYSLPADCIARTAYFLGKDPKHNSPFAQGAREVGKSYNGGKHDDITVTVAQVFVGTPASEDLKDPHYSESIFLYTVDVPPVADLPRLRRPRLVSEEL